MYRACSTWQYEVVAHLVEHHLGGSRLGYLTSDQYEALVRSEAEHRDDAAPRPAWRVLKSHEGHRCFQRAMAERRALAVYAYRDVREVVFSLMHKRGVTFDDLLRQGMIHQILASDWFWVAQAGTLVQRYEDLLADPVGGVLALAAHLGISLSAGEASRVADGFSVESNKARAEALRRRLEQVGLNLDDAANAQICDANTLLHWNHLRPSGTGSWVTQATPRQRVVFHRLFRRWLQARHYVLYPIDRRAGQVALPSLGPRERLRIEVDLAVARLAYFVRAASQRYPWLVRFARRILGIPTPAQVGATIWSEPKNPGNPTDSQDTSGAVPVAGAAAHPRASSNVETSVT
jgi:hypothetical protein